MGIIVLGIVLLLFAALIAGLVEKSQPAWHDRAGTLKIVRKDEAAFGGQTTSYYSGNRQEANWDWQNIISMTEEK